MSRILYTNVNGYQISKHSYSGGLAWSCPKKYYYKKVQGWTPREERSALEFGNAVEAAIQYHHTKNFEPGSGVDEFKILWFKQRDNTTITYTEKSGNWDDHYRMGVEMLSLYELERPGLPIDNVKFQVTINTDLFPGTEYEGLKHTTKLDMISEVSPEHPGYALLPPLEGSSGNRKLIIDIKTSANSYYSDARMSALDRQLREYAWSSGIETVSFLVLVKNPSDLTVGDWVTVISGPKALKKYQVFDVNDERVLVLSKSDYDEYMERKKSIKGKGAKEAQETLLSEYFYKGYRFLRNELTKQRIQFLPAIISLEDREEAGEVARMEAAEISDCGIRNYYPKKPGVRFPNAVCNSCDCLGLCLKDEKMTAEKLIQIGGDF